MVGEGAVLGGKGEPYHCADGTSGVVRSYHPLEQLRVSWHATPDSPPTIVEIDLRADGDGHRASTCTTTGSTTRTSATSWRCAGGPGSTPWPTR